MVAVALRMTKQLQIRVNPYATYTGDGKAITVFGVWICGSALLVPIWTVMFTLVE
jgi:hypothetical protein